MERKEGRERERGGGGGERERETCCSEGGAIFGSMLRSASSDTAFTGGNAHLEPVFPPSSLLPPPSSLLYLSL